MGRKSLGSLKASKTVHLASGGVGTWTPQSMAFKNRGTRYIICQKDGCLGIQIASESGHKTTRYRIHSGHGNGGCYCKKDGLVYVSSYSGSANKVVNSWDPSDNWKHVQTISLPVYCTGLGYDPVTENFYVNSSSGWSVFSYSEFTKKKGSKKHKNYSHKHSKVGYWQDAGGYGGVAFFCTSHQNSSSTSYVDCYRAADGKYLGSLTTRGEIESIAVDVEGHFHVLYAQNRRVVKCSNTFDNTFKKVQGVGANAPSAGSTTVVKNVPQGNKVAALAKKQEGNNYKKYCSWAGTNADWCAIFVRWVFAKCGLSKIMATVNYVPVDFSKQILAKGGKVIWSRDSRIGTTGGSKKNVLPGDICLYSGHVNIALEKSKDGKSIKTVGGNQHGKAPNGHWDINEVTVGMRSDQIWVIRPKYKDTAINGLQVTGDTYTTEEEGGGQGTLEVHPEKLYSSENYQYLVMQEDEEDKNAVQSAKAVQQVLETAKAYKSSPRDTSSNIGIITGGAKSEAKKPPTKVNGEARGSTLETALFPVEAPFAEITIGGKTFGAGWKDDAPNYINSLKVKRTNASMNEYTINLSHQVSPGRNPNYIDELLSANGYNKIGIKYGDAESGVAFEEKDALLYDVGTTFDFSSCNIKYTVSAISSMLLSSTNKRNRASVTDKGSNIAMGLLKEANSTLGQLYPKMLDSNYVRLNNLIPTSDAVINMGAVSNVNDVTYLKEIVANMQSMVDPNAVYYLEFRTDDFKIHEVSSSNYPANASLFEVDINYPDDAQIFSFNTGTDFAWSLAYEYNDEISNYTYDLLKNGMVSAKPGTTNTIFNDKGNLNISNNWWKQVTEFPTNATLTSRGLLSPLLLMTYIKVNSYYYGNKRLTSGVYIVTGQEDEISGNGFRTTLSLTKVSGPDQHLTVDARVKT